jgi:hypothetical protein
VVSRLPLRVTLRVRACPPAALSTIKPRDHVTCSWEPPNERCLDDSPARIATSLEGHMDNGCGEIGWRRDCRAVCVASSD